MSDELLSCVCLTPEQTEELAKVWNAALGACGGRSPVVEPVARPDVEMLVANLPADATGTLFVKFTGEGRQYENLHEWGCLFKNALRGAHPNLQIVIISTGDDVEMSLELLTDDKLEAIGFKRIERQPDYLGAARDVS
jgi:hypothetical protein